MDSKSSVKSPSENEVAMPPDTAKSRRTHYRRVVSLCCKRIEAILAERGSRRAVEVVLRRAQDALECSEKLNDELMGDLDPEEAEAEVEKQLNYLQKLEQTAEAVDMFLRSRVNETFSDVLQLEGDNDDSSVSSDDAAMQCAALAHTEVRKAGRSDTPQANAEKTAARQVGHLPTDAAVTVEFPDRWIDEYIAGRADPNARYDSGCRGSAVKAELDSYDGTAFKWFSWIDLFKALVHDTGMSPGEKLAVLRSSLKGDCRDIVYGLGGGEDAYKESLRSLKASCGRRDVIRAAHLQALDRLGPGKSPSQLKRFAERVRTHLFDLSRLGEVANADIVDRLVAKLAIQDRLVWHETRQHDGEQFSLEKFGRWLCKRAAAYQNAHELATEQAIGSGREPPERNFRSQARIHTATSQDERDKRCFSCSRRHLLSDCADFRKLEVDRRWRLIRKKKLCFTCLRGLHRSTECKMSKPCGINGCPGTHHPLLHRQQGMAQGSEANVNSACSKSGQVALGVVTVNVIDRNGNKVSANLFFDEGSDKTFVREGLLSKLQYDDLRIGQRSLMTRGFGGAKRWFNSRPVNLIIERLDGTARFDIVANTAPTLCDPVPAVSWPCIKGRWKHLADLPVAESKSRIDILLGLDHAELMSATESRSGDTGEPVAMNTALGWIARGVIGSGWNRLRARTNLSVSTGDEDLAVQFRQFCDTEAFGTEGGAPRKMAPEDELAKQIVESGTRKLEVGFEVPLSWRQGEPNLPCNRSLAELRLRALLRRFEKDPTYKADYEKAIDKYQSAGYAHEVTDEHELGIREQYFLPHHGVCKKSSGTRKLRIVFDSSAMYEGRSLNSALLTGPALQNELPLVLLKFGEGSVAFAADIEAMFSRIRLRPEDARYHRYLWKDPESERVKVFQMDRVSFGDTCSPFIAISTILRTAHEFGQGREEAVRAIHHSLYMDDYLDSARTIAEAIARARDVQDILRKGDFHLSKWISNCKELVETFGGESSLLAPAEEYHLGEDTFATKVLGVRWRPHDDVLVFHVDLGEVVFTRRGLLSKMAKIYDPLGLLSPAVTRAKIMHRQLGLSGLNWDDDIPTVQKKWWEHWIGQLEELKSFSIPRCLFPREGEIASSELHTFGDASEEAFAAAVYLRNVYNDGDVTVRIVMAKSRLAPLKTVSVARLELQAALLGARLATYVGSGLTRPIGKRIFWTDSSCVRNWIRSPAAYYKPYVSHRIGEIQTLTDPSEWRFVPGRLNISDCATRSVRKERELIDRLWFCGPEFLRSPEDVWPPDLPWMASSEERRTTCEGRILHVAGRQPTDWSCVNDLEADEFAGFTRVEGKFLETLKKAQRESFPGEIADLQAGKPLRKSSTLLSFSPFIDDRGLLRIGGRLGRAPLPYDSLHPVLLPARHPLPKRITEEFHFRMKHSGTDSVLSAIRQHFWILRGRQLVKSVRKSCLQCAKESVKTEEQLMAELPTERLAVGCPPFHHTAVDYFGPFLVKSERNRGVKRYGVIFTCLTVRAVYLDIAQSLSTDDFLLVLRRFVSVYGKPESIHSDNGRNFVGVAKEVRRAVQALNQDRVLRKYTNGEGIQWKFQPANAPHFGGAHESLVKSAKGALYRMLGSSALDSSQITEEVFRTLLFEVAGLLNSRPITYASSDVKDHRPLTPNDFMNRPSFVHVPVGTFSHPSLGQRHKEVESLSTRFWDLWKKHYLPTLIQRTKWKVQRRNLSVGDYVLLAEPNVPKGQWIGGRVEAVFPGSDGLVRVVKVATKSGTYIRPIHRLCSLHESSSPGLPGTCSGGQEWSGDS